MITNKEVIDAAMSPASDEELRNIIDSELRDIGYETSELKLIIAADLVCDAALDVVAQLTDEPSMKKNVVLGPNTVALSSMSIVSDLKRMFEDDKVTMAELQSLLLRSSISDAISKALEAGASKEELAGAEIALSPIRLTQILEEQPKAKGLLSRLFGGR